MFWTEELFWWGLFGSLLPEIIRTYHVVTRGVRPKVTRSAAGRFEYFAVSAAYAFSAGLFTYAWQPENEFKAIWVGVSFPLLVSAMLRGPLERSR